jgi:hypothetical protein
MKYITFEGAKETLHKVGITLDRNFGIPGQGWIYSMTYPDGTSYSQETQVTYRGSGREDNSQDILHHMVSGGLGLLAGTWKSDRLVRGVEEPYKPVVDEEQKSLAMQLWIEHAEEAHAR